MKPVSTAWCSPSTSTSTVFGVTADPGVGLEDGDVVVRVEEVGRHEPGHAGPDDGDLQLRFDPVGGSHLFSGAVSDLDG